MAADDVLVWFTETPEAVKQTQLISPILTAVTINIGGINGKFH